MRVPGVFATYFGPPGEPVGTALVVPGRGYPPAANRAPQLLVGGSGDDAWDSAVASKLARSTCSVVEIAYADHAMLIRGDVIRGVEAHVDVVRAVDDWLGRV